jgi:hypothetical protein
MGSNPRTAGSSIRARVVTVLVAFSLSAIAPAALGGPKGTERPLKGACDATFAIVNFEPGPPPVETLAIELTCHLTHLGLTAGAATQRVTLGPPPFGIATTIVYAAANGDELYATFSGQGFPSPDGSAIAFAGMTVYAGGTGRFVNASGWSLDAGGASLVTSEGSLEVSGKISY